MILHNFTQRSLPEGAESVLLASACHKSPLAEMLHLAPPEAKRERG